MSNTNLSSGLSSLATSLSEQTVGYLQFFKRWDTPLDDEATRAFSSVARNAPDYDAFQALAPAGSEQRKLFLRHLDSFEEAATLIREGKMREDLFFDGWYTMPQSWHRAAPFVIGLRGELNDPHLYEGFEWLAGRAEAFWAEREQNPVLWQPITNHEPEPGDYAIFEAFNEIWSTPRDPVARAFVAELAKRAPDFETFSQIVQPGSEEYIKFDRVFCAYDQAGTLIKNGIVHPRPFFDSWQSPIAIYGFSEPWLRGIRETRHNPHVYENLDWLAEYEAEWRDKARLS